MKSITIKCVVHLQLESTSLKKHYMKFFANKVTVTDADIIRFKRVMLKTKKYKHRDDTYSEATVNRIIQYCAAAFTKAKVTPNPFAEATKFQEHERTRHLTEDEFLRLLEAVGKSPHPDLAVIVQTGIQTGLRKNEVLGLHRDHIDFGRNKITVPGRIRKNNQPLMIPLPVELKSEFELRAKINKSGYIFQNEATKNKWKGLRPAWPNAKKEAKIENFRFHDLRHTFATYLLMEGKSLATVQRLLGHRSIMTTMKYAHVADTMEEDAIKSIGRLFRKNDGEHDDESD